MILLSWKKSLRITNIWLGNICSKISQLPGAADREAYEATKDTAPDVATYPNVYAWYILVKRFSDAVRATWGGAAPQKGKKEEKKEEAKPAAPAKKEEEEDELDLFGDDDDEEDSVRYI